MNIEWIICFVKKDGIYWKSTAMNNWIWTLILSFNTEIGASIYCLQTRTSPNLFFIYVTTVHPWIREHFYPKKYTMLCNSWPSQIMLFFPKTNSSQNEETAGKDFFWGKIIHHAYPNGVLPHKLYWFSLNI